MRIKRLGPLALSLLLVGCATSTSNLPRGAQLVGGGLMVEYEAPADGTAILIERNSGRIVATESLREANSFTFNPNRDGYEEVLFRMFGSAQAIQEGAPLLIPTNTFFQLYFVPSKPKKE